MKKLSIVIPVFNEVKNISNIIETLQSYPESLEVHFCDGGSSDGTLDLLKQIQNKLNFNLHHEKLPSPSIQKTLNIALPHIKTNYFMIHPVDANAKSVLEEINRLNDIDTTHLIPFKKYDSAHIILSLQEKVLNALRVKILKSFVWTNCPVISLDSYKKISTPPEGFLEDVILSDQLKKLNASPKIIKKPVIISSRRYHTDGVLTRFLGNLYIMLLFRLKLRSIDELKKMYYRQN